MSTKQELDLIQDYLGWVAESDGGSAYEEVLLEFNTVRAIVENNNAQDWLDGLVEEFLGSATEWKKDGN